MPKLTQEQLEARRAANQKEALRSISKSEQLNLRMDAQGIERLYEMSEKTGKPIGTMVREWIMERLDQEEAGTDEPPAVALAIIQRKVSQLQQKLSHPPKNRSPGQARHEDPPQRKALLVLLKVRAKQSKVADEEGVSFVRAR